MKPLSPLSTAIVLVLVSGCAHGPATRRHVLPATIPPEDQLCVERFPPEMNRWTCIRIDDLRELFSRISKVEP